ncbi:MAG: hypothetical protein DMF06_08060 [Verrucomicrobia bacterium]|jgi:hypothetical protein|nr:MAG: hypothetical protein DMF06_08060 [Verrucomicrobiota bacterium]
MLVNGEPSPETTTVPGYGAPTPPSVLNVTELPQKVPGGVGVGVGVTVGVGVGIGVGVPLGVGVGVRVGDGDAVGVGVGLGAVAVIVRSQLVTDPVSPPEAASSKI